MTPVTICISIFGRIISLVKILKVPHLASWEQTGCVAHGAQQTRGCVEEEGGWRPAGAPVEAEQLGGRKLLLCPLQEFTDSNCQRKGSIFRAGMHSKPFFGEIPVNRSLSEDES